MIFSKPANFLRVYVFVNSKQAHLVRFLTKYHAEISLSRSHSQRPNDNRYVEVKNCTLVRAYLGHARLDTVKQNRYLNRIYELLDRYYNYLQPVLHLTSKDYQPATDGRTANVRRKHDEPLPPLDWLCQDPANADLCAPLRETQAALNPLTLRQRIYEALEHLWTYPAATPQQPEDVYQTLAHPGMVHFGFPEGRNSFTLLNSRGLQKQG